MTLFVFLVCSFTGALTWATEVKLDSNTTQSSEGYFVLGWQTPNSNTKNTKLTLRQADNAGMRYASVLHELPVKNNNAGKVTLTGYPDGDYFFQLDASKKHFSNVIKIQVKHHSLNKAFSFFILGLALFAMLCVCIIWGHRAHKDQHS